MKFTRIVIIVFLGALFQVHSNSSFAEGPPILDSRTATPGVNEEAYGPAVQISTGNGQEKRQPVAPILEPASGPANDELGQSALTSAGADKALEASARFSADAERIAEQRRRAATERDRILAQRKHLAKVTDLGTAAEQQPQGRPAQEWQAISALPDNVITDGKMTIGQVYTKRQEFEKRLKEREAEVIRLQQRAEEQRRGSLDTANQLAGFGNQLAETSSGLNSLTETPGSGVPSGFPNGFNPSGQLPGTNAGENSPLAVNGIPTPGSDFNAEEPLDLGDPLGKTSGVGSLDTPELSDSAKALLADNEKAKIEGKIDKEHFDALEQDLAQIRKEDNLLSLVRQMGRDAGIEELANVKSVDELRSMNDKLEQAGLKGIVDGQLADIAAGGTKGAGAEVALGDGENIREGAEGEGGGAFDPLAGLNLEDQSFGNAMAGVMGGLKDLKDGLETGDKRSAKKKATRVAGTSRLPSSTPSPHTDLEDEQIPKSRDGIGNINAELFSRARAAHWRALREDKIRLPQIASSESIAIEFDQG